MAEYEVKLPDMTGTSTTVEVDPTGKATSLTINTVKAETGSKGDFNWVYDSCWQGNSLNYRYKTKDNYYVTQPLQGGKNIVSNGYGLRITYLDTYRPYYMIWGRDTSIDDKTVKGRCQATPGIVRLNFNTKNARNTSMSNCGSWVEGRLVEIWDTAIRKGYIVKTGSEGNNDIYEIRGGSGLDVPLFFRGRTFKVYNKWNPMEEKFIHKTPAKWFENSIGNWPNGTDQEYSGFMKSNDKKKFPADAATFSSRPLPGCVMCFKKKYATAGHVEFVEKVVNAGTKDEYVITSRSSAAYKKEWTKLTGTVVAITKRKKFQSGYKNPYGQHGDYVFQGFWYNPVCYLSGSNSSPTITATEIPEYFSMPAENLAIKSDYNTADITLFQNYITVLRDSGKIVVPTYNVGTKVKILFGDGRPNPDGSGQPISVIGTIATILSVNTTREYAYELSIDGVTPLGFFKGNYFKVIT